MADWILLSDDSFLPGKLKQIDEELEINNHM